ncbi:MAG: hypothetical protein WC867_03750 [Candidatus Pacearchaeota archaeon]
MIIDTIYLTWRIKEIPEENKAESSILFWNKYLFFLSLIIISISHFIKIDLIKQIYPNIIGFSISTGFLILYSSKKRFEKELEEEKEIDEKMENKRSIEFPNKFKNINKIPLIRNIIKFMYKSGWEFSFYLTLITLIFLFIKIYFIVFHPIMVSDDWQAIFVGKIFLETGKFPSISSIEGPYFRGLYLSLLTSVFFYIFGQNIYIAKTIPAFLGLINLILVYFISKNISKNKKIILISMILYAIHPLIIFNHWFIRFYVFYEFFFLIIILLFIILINKTNNISLNQKLLIICLILIINLINWFFGFDDGKYIILIITIISFIYLNLIKINKKKIIILLIIPILILIIYLFFPLIQNKINFFLNVKLPNSNHLDLKVVLFEKNILLILFFVIGFLIFYKNSKLNYLFYVTMFMLILHLISSQDLQMSRSILYLISAIIIGASITLVYFIKIIKNKLIISIFILIIIINFINMYPPGFIKNHPYLENELHYQDDLGVYTYINENLKDYTIIQSNYEIMSEVFFNSKTEYIFISNEKEIKAIPYIFFDNSSNIYRQISTKTPVIYDKDKFFYDIKYKKVVLIASIPSSRYYLDKESLNMILLNLPNKKEFEGYVIYYN